MKIAGAHDPGWLVDRRHRALDRYRQAGPPDKKREAWRFTPARPLLEGAFKVAHADPEECARWALAEVGQDGSFRLPMIHGRPQLEAAGSPPAGVEVARISDLLRDAPGRIEELLGAIDTSDELAALNTALFEDGVVVRFTAGQVAERPVHLVYAGGAGPDAIASYPRLLVIAEAGSRGQLIESYPDDGGADRHLTNAVAEIALESGARLDHARFLVGGAARHHIGRLAVRQDAASRYRSYVVTLGGALSRLELRLVSAGQGAETRLIGLYHAGDHEHVDHHTLIEHAGAGGTSHESYRGVVDGSGHAVFDGTVVVRPGAQKTEAHQENRNLVLSDRATVHTKPHLRIDADDVKCSHGATVGPPDDDSLHYLRSRGIGRERALEMLTHGFVDQLLAELPNPRLIERATEELGRRLGRQEEEGR